jgi:hypothetical protein
MCQDYDDGLDEPDCAEEAYWEHCQLPRTPPLPPHGKADRDLVHLAGLVAPLRPAIFRRSAFLRRPVKTAAKKET